MVFHCIDRREEVILCSMFTLGEEQHRRASGSQSSGTGQTPVRVGSLTLCFYRKPPRAFPSV